jgi:hypothetical protein
MRLLLPLVGRTTVSRFAALQTIHIAGTFCGVFRRQALDRGAALMRADKIVTGHNADDIAETVLMNCKRAFTFARAFSISHSTQCCAATLHD